MGKLSLEDLKKLRDEKKKALDRRGDTGKDVEIRYDVGDPERILREATGPVYHAHFPYYAPAVRVKGWRLERMRDDLPLHRVVREGGR